LDVRELEKLLDNLGLPISNETAYKFFLEADINGSGNISVDEFISFIWTIRPKTQMEVSAAAKRSHARDIFFHLCVVFAIADVLGTARDVCGQAGAPWPSPWPFHSWQIQAVLYSIGSIGYVKLAVDSEASDFDLYENAKAQFLAFCKSADSASMHRPSSCIANRGASQQGNSGIKMAKHLPATSKNIVGEEGRSLRRTDFRKILEGGNVFLSSNMLHRLFKEVDKSMNSRVDLNEVSQPCVCTLGTKNLTVYMQYFLSSHLVTSCRPLPRNLYKRSLSLARCTNSPPQNNDAVPFVLRVSLRSHGGLWPVSR
jgi:Ca2+-binding EF-hand superfamily protein